ncbi:hypothetical protein Tco_0064585 [Tanacetum coccineum]
MGDIRGVQSLQEDSDPEQARRDKDMQRTWLLLAKAVGNQRTMTVVGVGNSNGSPGSATKMDYSALTEVSPEESSSTSQPWNKYKTMMENDEFAQCSEWLTGKETSNPFKIFNDSPLTGVNTPGSDENRLKLYDLMYIIVNVADMMDC